MRNALEHGDDGLGFDPSLHIMMLFHAQLTASTADTRLTGVVNPGQHKREREFLAPSIHSLCVRATKGKG